MSSHKLSFREHFGTSSGVVGISHERTVGRTFQFFVASLEIIFYKNNLTDLVLGRCYYLIVCIVWGRVVTGKMLLKFTRYKCVIEKSAHFQNWIFHFFPPFLIANRIFFGVWRGVFPSNHKRNGKKNISDQVIGDYPTRTLVGYPLKSQDNFLKLAQP